jgi:hypothetical protein
MRSHKTADQIKNEGFCAYGENEKQNIIEALKFFGRQDAINQKGYLYKAKKQDNRNIAILRNAKSLLSQYDKKSYDGYIITE